MYGSFTNGITYAESGDYIQRFVNLSGCDSNFYLSLVLDHPIDEPIIKVEGFILSTNSTYSSYQWLKNGQPITNATGSSYEVSANAEYSVVVTNDKGCTGTSRIYKVTNYTRIYSVFNEADIKVFPNPAGRVLYVKASIAVIVSLYDMQGRVLKRSGGNSEIHLDELHSGFYIIQVMTEDGRIIKREKVAKSR